MHVIVTRPRADAAGLREALEGLGHQVSLAPVLEMRATGAALSFDSVQGIIATSRNALRTLTGHADLAHAAALPLFVVGQASAALARELGFTQVHAGDGGARELPPVIVETVAPAGGPLLYLRGDAVAFDLEPPLVARGYDVAHQVVYESVAAESLPTSVVNAVRNGNADAVVLMSARSAHVFSGLLAQHGLTEPARRLTYVCLSPGVAQALESLAPVRVTVAKQPTSEEILALIKELASNQS